MRKLNFIYLLISLIVLSVACSKDTKEEALAEFKIEKNELQILVNEKAEVKITSGNGEYSVASSDEAIAKAQLKSSVIEVSSSKAGTAKVTITDAKSKKTSVIIVTSFENISLSEDNIAIEKGETKTVQLKGSGEYSVVSSNNEIATAKIEKDDENVKVIITAVANGESTIKITDVKTKKETQIKVLVSEFSIEKTAVSVGEGRKIELTINGSGSYEITSNDKEIADAVYKNGKIEISGLKNKSNAYAVITINDKKYGKSATVEVRVFKLELAEDKKVVGPGRKTTVRINNGSGKYDITSSSDGIATAVYKTEHDNYFIEITGVAQGKATITIKDKEINQTKTIEVDVKTPDLVLAKYTLSLGKGESDIIDIISGSGNYEVSAVPANLLTDLKISTPYREGDPYTIPINTAKPGKTTITVKDKETNQTKTIEVTINISNPFNVSESSISIQEGKTNQTIRVRGGYESFTATSADATIASAEIIDNGGSPLLKITAMKQGSTTITIKDGSPTDDTKTVTVTVTPAPTTPANPYTIVNGELTAIDCDAIPADGILTINGITSIKNGVGGLCKKIKKLIVTGNQDFSTKGKIFINSSLEEIELPENTKQLSQGDFYNLTNLKKVIIKAKTPPTWNGNPFIRIPLTAELIVPKGSKSLYEAETKTWAKPDRFGGRIKEAE